MNKTILKTIGLIILLVALFVGGVLLGQANAQGFGGMMGFGNAAAQSGAGMMNGGMMTAGAGMMNGGMMGAGAGMMNSDMMNGMMAGNSSAAVNDDPLTIQEARDALETYLDGLGDENLVLGEIMVFDNHAYAQILYRESGRGAFEVLVDPLSRTVYPEHGPNMMWNSEYGAGSGAGMAGMMGTHAGMMAGMMGTNAGTMADMMAGMMNGEMMNGMMGSYAPEAEASVSAEEAAAIAQRYLDSALPGTVVGEAAVAFPGYYTLHVEQEGKITGMLSVSAYTGQSFYHFWHGAFIEQAGE